MLRFKNGDKNTELELVSYQIITVYLNEATREAIRYTLRNISYDTIASLFVDGAVYELSQQLTNADGEPYEIITDLSPYSVVGDVTIGRNGDLSIIMAKKTEMETENETLKALVDKNKELWNEMLIKYAEGVQEV